MRIGVACLYNEIPKVLEIVEKNTDFINHIEIGIDTVSQIEEVAPFIDKIEELGLSIGVHLAMEINTSEDIEYVRNSWVKFCVDMCIGVEKLNPAYINLHLGYALKNRFLRNKERYLKNTVDFFLKLDNYLEKLSRTPVITVENSYNLVAGEVINIGTTSYEFEYILKNIRNINKNIDIPYFCFDTGHYILSRDNYSELGKFTKVVHISDCSGNLDDHLQIFSGKLKKDDLKMAIDMKPEFAVIEVKYDCIEKSIENIRKFFIYNNR